MALGFVSSPGAQGMCFVPLNEMGPFLRQALGPPVGGSGWVEECPHYSQAHMAAPCPLQGQEEEGAGWVLPRGFTPKFSRCCPILVNLALVRRSPASHGRAGSGSDHSVLGELFSCGCWCGNLCWGVETTAFPFPVGKRNQPTVLFIPVGFVQELRASPARKQRRRQQIFCNKIGFFLL